MLRCYIFKKRQRYLFALVKIAHSMNQFEYSFIGLTLSSSRRVVTHSFKRIEFVSHFIPFLPSRLFGYLFRGVKGEGFLTPGASRRVAARRGAVRRDAARRAGREHARRAFSRPASQEPPLDGITMETDVPIPLFSEIFPHEASRLCSLSARLLPAACAERKARAAPAAFVPPWAEGRRIELGRILRGSPPRRAVDFLIIRERGYARLAADA